MASLGISTESSRAPLAAYHVPDGMYDQYASQSTAPYTGSLPSEVFAAVTSDRMLRISSYRVAEAQAHPQMFELGWRSPVVHPQPADAPRFGSVPAT